MRVTMEQIMQEQGLPLSYPELWESAMVGTPPASPVEEANDAFAPYQAALDGRLVAVDSVSPLSQIRTRVAGWIIQAKNTFDLVDTSLGSQPGEESPFAAEWRADAAARRLAAEQAAARPQPSPVPPSLPPRGAWVASPIEAPPNDFMTASDRARQVYGKLDMGVAAARVALKNLAVTREATRRTQKIVLEDVERAAAQAKAAAEKEAARLAAVRERVVTDTVAKHPQFGWLASKDPKDQADIERVIKTVEDVRAIAARAGREFSDQEVFRVYRQAAEATLGTETKGANNAGTHGRTGELQTSCRILEALMGGTYKGKLPF